MYEITCKQQYKKNSKDLENFLEKNLLFKYLYFLRLKGADLNTFFDEIITQNKTNEKNNNVIGIDTIYHIYNSIIICRNT